MMDNKLSPTAKIKALMYDAKINAADIGRELNVSRVFVHLTIKGVKRGERVREVLSKKLDLSPDFWNEMDRWRKAA
jgi:DNA-binding transcriptional regulator LsrR (DeoR family)